MIFFVSDSEDEVIDGSPLVHTQGRISTQSLPHWILLPTPAPNPPDGTATTAAAHGTATTGTAHGGTATTETDDDTETAGAADGTEILGDAGSTERVATAHSAETTNAEEVTAGAAAGTESTYAAQDIAGAGGGTDITYAAEVTAGAAGGTETTYAAEGTAGDAGTTAAAYGADVTYNACERQQTNMANNFEQVESAPVQPHNLLLIDVPRVTAVSKETNFFDVIDDGALSQLRKPETLRNDDIPCVQAMSKETNFFLKSGTRHYHKYGCPKSYVMMTFLAPIFRTTTISFFQRSGTRNYHNCIHLNIYVRKNLTPSLRPNKTGFGLGLVTTFYPNFNYPALKIRKKNNENEVAPQNSNTHNVLGATSAPMHQNKPDHEFSDAARAVLGNRVTKITRRASLTPLCRFVSFVAYREDLVLVTNEQFNLLQCRGDQSTERSELLRFADSSARQSFSCT